MDEIAMDVFGTPLLDDRTVLRAADFSTSRAGGAVVALAPRSPNWVITDDRGARLLSMFDGRTPLGDVVRRYAVDSHLDVARAWLHVDTFARDALRTQFLSTDGAVQAPYLGRSAYLQLDRLDEVWLHVNDFCNLRCEHCLVSSGPGLDQGLPTEVLTRVIDEAAALGTRRFFFTGGEPLARQDAIELLTHVIETRGREAVLMTNGTVFKGERLARLVSLAATGRLRVQVSLDGAGASTNDPIRGEGTFDRIVAGVRDAIAAGITPTLTMTLLRHNLGDAAAFVTLAGSLGVSNVHLLWPHRRGRLLTGPFGNLPSTTELLNALRSAEQAARGAGVTIDNVEEFRLRLDGAPGVKRDLAGAGWSSLCVYTDGYVYPSASTAGEPGLRGRSILDGTLEAAWKESDVLMRLRSATVEQKSQCRDCELKFLCGGGDVEHAYWASAARGRASFLADDPYCDLYKGMAADAFRQFAQEGQEAVPPRTGYDRPVVLRARGQRILEDGERPIVATTHSACVLSEEVLDKSRRAVSAFYGEAADTPQVELCCPVQPDASDLTHIPPEVVERFYGCGSPVSAAALVPGEVMVDLGSGAGIDCFIAAKHVGPEGRVYGVDMTDQMLSVARECQPKVASALGYDAVEFRKGFLESIPADVVTSNCVINLSADKPAVLREVWRVLKDHGRAVIADIVADREVPPKMRADGQLWGECISGALTEEAFLAEFERAGFYGVGVLKKTFWREVEGCQFYSVTARGYKFEKKAGCTYVGQYAVYLGPMKATMDEEGHLFPRGVPIEVCTDTAAKLSHAPYAGSFAVVDGPSDYQASDNAAGCEPGSGCC